LPEGAVAARRLVDKAPLVLSFFSYPKVHWALVRADVETMKGDP
jgi:hypothetical protein